MSFLTFRGLIVSIDIHTVRLIDGVGPPYFRQLHSDLNILLFEQGGPSIETAHTLEVSFAQ
jgi:hypothetical protein